MIAQCALADERRREELEVPRFFAALLNSSRPAPANVPVQAQQ